MESTYSKYNRKLSEKFPIDQIFSEESIVFFEDMKTLVKYYFETDEHFNVCKAVKQLQIKHKNQQLKNKGQIMQPNDPDFESFMKSDMVQSTIEDEALYNDYFNFIDRTKNKWVLKIDKKGGQAYSMKEEGESMVSVFAETIVEAPIVYCMAVYSEMEFYKDLSPDLISFEQYQQMSKFKALFGFKIKMPKPLWKREMVFRNNIIFDHENKGLLSIFKSFDQDEYFDAKIPKDKDIVRITIKKGYEFYQYIDQNKTRYQKAYLMDMHMKYIPDWLLNTFFPNGMHDELMMMRAASEKAFKDEKSVYKERIAQKPSYYKPIEEFAKKIQESKS